MAELTTMAEHVPDGKYRWCPYLYRKAYAVGDKTITHYSSPVVAYIFRNVPVWEEWEAVFYVMEYTKIGETVYRGMTPFSYKNVGLGWECDEGTYFANKSIRGKCLIQNDAEEISMTLHNKNVRITEDIRSVSVMLYGDSFMDVSGYFDENYKHSGQYLEMNVSVKCDFKLNESTICNGAFWVMFDVIHVGSENDLWDQVTGKQAFAYYAEPQ